MKILELKILFLTIFDNQFDTISLLKISKRIEQEIQKYNPDTILTYHNGDLNIDHQRTSRAVHKNVDLKSKIR